ncbi:MAG: glycine cleavage system protein GcvH [Candidatus Thermoplasmatota archaeon]|jgi:glycine cleavage system H protein|nr:glycine cleavage system protein GcvH [Candidatus Thermoplasmatota archaeon]MDP7266081.1 glycine cleavage system protein GcvH [Candidatus Thermoplasmatota archaeon]
MTEEFEIDNDLRYTKNHEWIRVEGVSGLVGVTDFAQKQLGDITYIEFEVEEDDEVGAGEIFTTVEAVKASEPCYLPASGKIIELNYELEDEPELVNKDPYRKGWMVKIELTEPSQLEKLLSPAEYGELLKEVEHQ